MDPDLAERLRPGASVRRALTLSFLVVVGPRPSVLVQLRFDCVQLS